VTPHSFLSDSEGPAFVPPALWLCPMHSGFPFRGIASSLTSSPRYAKYLDWLHSPPNWFHSPPNFAAIRLNDSDQRSNPMSLIKLYSEARQANSSCDMRMYLDDRDEHRAILKFSPHVSSASFCPMPYSVNLIPSCHPSAFRSSLIYSQKAPMLFKVDVSNHCATQSALFRAALASISTFGFLQTTRNSLQLCACSQQVTTLATCSHQAALCWMHSGRLGHLL
jgi:hypothetical protein